MADTEEVDMAAMFDTSKKKKKSTKAKKDKAIDDLTADVNALEVEENPIDKEDAAAAPETVGESEVDVAAVFGEKKKSKKKKAAKSDKGEENTAGETGSSTNVETPPSYSYALLLQRVVDLLHENNPDMIEKKRGTLKPPQLMKVGTKKTLWTNFNEICQMMNRNPDHVMQFMMAELGAEGSIDGLQRLVIKGKFVPKYIESLLRKYIGEYVTCQMCRSFKTTLTRDSVSRLYFVECQDCGSKRSVAAIKSGYHAQTRADRRALRNA